MEKLKFNISSSTGNTELTINDLGNPLNQEFVHLHKRFLEQGPFDFSELHEPAHSYFDSHIGDWATHNAFFENFTIIWRRLLETGGFVAAESVWESALALASSWENTHRSHRLHKGTPYYFWGMTVVSRGDLDRGFLLIHQALDEDIQSYGTLSDDTPASAFATLDYQKQDQAFRSTVQEAAAFLDRLLTDYRQARGKALTLDKFRDSLFHTTELRDPLFFFVFALFKMKTLLTGMRPIRRTNEFAGLLETGLLFDLCLVIDSVIGYKNPESWRFIDHMAYLSSECHFSLNQDKLRNLWPRGQDLAGFAEVVKALLGGTFRSRDGQELTPAEVDISLAYGLRNLGAHRVERLPIIYEKFEDVSQRIMNVLFLAVEHLF